MVKVDENLEKLVKQEQKQLHQRKLYNIASTVFSFGAGVTITTIAVLDRMYQHTKGDYFPVIAAMWAGGCFYLTYRSYQDYKKLQKQ